MPMGTVSGCSSMAHWVMTSDRNDDCNGLVIINYIISSIRTTSPEFHPEGIDDPDEIQLQEEDSEGIIPPSVTSKDKTYNYADREVDKPYATFASVELK
jgi:hypothetical protein